MAKVLLGVVVAPLVALVLLFFQFLQYGMPRLRRAVLTLSPQAATRIGGAHLAAAALLWVPGPAWRGWRAANWPWGDDVTAWPLLLQMLVCLGGVVGALWWLGQAGLWRRLGLWLHGGPIVRTLGGPLLRRARHREVLARIERAALGLGAPEEDARLEAVRGLGELADLHRGVYKQRVVDALCGFLRGSGAEASEVARRSGEASGASEVAAGVAVAQVADPAGAAHAQAEDGAALADTQLAVLELISSHLRAPAKTSWSACCFDLTGAVLAAPVEFERCEFFAPVSFAGAMFQGNANFSRARFWRGADFTSAEFGGHTKFVLARFPARTSFAGASFRASCDFTAAMLGEGADFSGLTVQGGLSFANALLGRGASLAGARFADTAECSGAGFGARANFRGCAFNSFTAFDGSRFGAGADFDGAAFARGVDFFSASFSENASFAGVTFGADPNATVPRYMDDAFHTGVRFSTAAFGPGAAFQGARFTGEAIYAGASFRRPPRFDGALFEGPVYADRTNHARQNWFAGAVFSDPANRPQ